MGTTANSFPSGGIRVSDAERDQAIAELSEHFQAGRLTQEEFDDRSGQALRARTGSDLDALFTDLPRSTVPAPQAGDQPLYAGGPHPVTHMPVARFVILCVLAAVIVGNVAGGTVGGAGLGWLVPVVVLGFVFLRLARR